MGSLVVVDTGTARIHVCATEAHGRAQIQRSSSALLWVAPNGDVVGGAAARDASVAAPEHLLTGWVERIGDPVPFHARGAVIGADEVLRGALSPLLAEVSDEIGRSIDQVALVIPDGWSVGRRRRVEAAAAVALQDEFADATIVTVLRSEAQRAALVVSDDESAGAALVLDVGASAVRAHVLSADIDADAARGVVEPGLGGDRLDDRVLRHVLDQVPSALRTRATPEELVRLRHACREARVALSTETETSIQVRMGGAASELRLVRPELEALLDDDLHKVLEVGQRAVDTSGGVLSRVVLVGGCAATPRLAQMASSRWSCPVDRPADPATSILGGVAGLLERRAGSTPEVDGPQQEVGTPTRTPVQVTDTEESGADAWPAWLPDAREDELADRGRSVRRVLVGASLAIVLAGATGAAMAFLPDTEPSAAANSVVTETVTAEAGSDSVLPGPWAPGVTPPTADDVERATEESTVAAALGAPRATAEALAGSDSSQDARREAAGSRAGSEAGRPGSGETEASRGSSGRDAEPSSSRSPSGGAGSTPGRTATSPSTPAQPSTTDAEPGTPAPSGPGTTDPTPDPSPSAPEPTPEPTTPDPTPDPTPEPTDPGPSATTDPGTSEPQPEPTDPPAGTTDPGTSDPAPTGGDGDGTGTTSGPGTEP